MCMMYRTASDGNKILPENGLLTGSPEQASGKTCYQYDRQNNTYMLL